MYNLKALFAFLFVYNLAFSQSGHILKFGNLDTSVVSVEEFIAQNKLTADKSYSIEKATVFFSGANFYNIKQVGFYPVFDSLKFSECKKAIVPGSAVTFTAVLKNKSSGVSEAVNLFFVFYSLTKKPFQPPSKDYLEWKRLRNLNYVSGTIYFSGTSYNNVLICTIGTRPLSELQKAFDLCMPGTIITFENAVYRDEKKNTEALNMTFSF